MRQCRKRHQPQANFKNIGDREELSVRAEHPPEYFFQREDFNDSVVRCIDNRGKNGWTHAHYKSEPQVTLNFSRKRPLSILIEEASAAQ